MSSLLGLSSGTLPMSSMMVETTKDKKERFESRQKQIELSKLRGEKHIGGQQKK